MAQTLVNGAVVPTNSDEYDLTSDLVTMCLSLNIPIPVASATERNGLAALTPGGVLKVGTMVLRKDQSMFVEKWDGATWRTSGHIEWSRLNQVVPSGQVWGGGAFNLDNNKTTDSAFVTHPSGDTLRFRDAGTYAITFTAVAENLFTGRSYLQIQTSDGRHFRVVVTGEDRGFVAVPNYRAAANETLVFAVYHSSGANRTVDFRIGVTRVA